MTSLYNDKHSVIIASNKDKRKIEIKVEIETVNSGVTNKELFIRLTDADSLSFLFCLRINDDNFQELKHQQGLLVDLHAFGQKLVDLLELCKSEQTSDCPKYILKMCGNGELSAATLPGANWTLNFIETNPFKHLTHLSLKFAHGDVEQFKTYLIDCLKNCRMDNYNLASQLEHTESSLLKKLKDSEMSLEDCKDQLQKLQISSRSQLEELRMKLEQQIDKDKDKLIETENYYKTKHDQERQDIESNFLIRSRNYEAKLQDLERTNKCLCDENSKVESDLREMKSRYENLDESYKRYGHEIQNLRRGKEQCDKDNHELECQMQRMHTKIAVLEQEVRDKDQILSRTQDLHATEQEAKNRYMDESQKRARQIEKLEKAVKNLNDEVAKGNEIIQKLQNDIKHCHSKIKVRTQITAEQEKALGERESEIKRLACDLETTKKELSKAETETEKSNLNLDQMTKKLEEASHVIKTNENVINWLNRQVTEYELTKQKTGFSGLPPRSHTGTAFSTCTESTVKYRPVSATPNLSNGDNCGNSILAGIAHRGKLSANAGGGPISQSQAPYDIPYDSSKAFLSCPYSSDKAPTPTCPAGNVDPKYLIKSSATGGPVVPFDRTNWSKINQFDNQPMRKPISGAISIPEEPEPAISAHQQSLSSAYFPKQL